MILIEDRSGDVPKDTVTLLDVGDSLAYFVDFACNVRTDNVGVFLEENA